MLAGVAKVCVTPPVGTWQGGYGARTRPAEGVHDDLFARALVLDEPGAGPAGQRCAVVSVDVVSLPHDMADGARRAAEALTGIAAERIAICASHTHGGPLTRSMAALGAGGAMPDEAYVRTFEKLIAGAVAAAARTLRPVTVRIGHGEAGFNVNRRLRTDTGTLMRPNPNGVVDRDVAVIRLDGDGASVAAEPSLVATMAPSAPPLAALFRYTCHATSMGSDNYLFTADYPGAAAAFVEQAYGGQTAALFLQGCTGNIRPHYAGAGGGFRGATWEEVGRAGRELGSAVVSAAERATPRALALDDVASLAFSGTMVTLPYAPASDEAALERALTAGQWPDGARVSDADREWAARVRVATAEGTLPRGADAEVQVARLGGAWLVLLPGEVFVEIGWHARDAVAAAVGAKPDDVIVAAYSNGNVGYVPTGAAIPEGGYEVTAHRRQAGRQLNTGYTAEAENVLVEAATTVAIGLR